MTFLSLTASIASADSVRSPFGAGRIYPADKKVLRKQLSVLSRKSPRQAIPKTEKGTLKALILPHGGMKTTGDFIGPLLPLLKKEKIEKVIVLSPDHRFNFSGIAVSGYDSWKTPLGIIPVHPDSIRLRKAAPKLFRKVPFAERIDTSIEGILPFLQFSIDAFEFVPMITGHFQVAQGGKAIVRLLPEAGSPEGGVTEKTLLIVLSNFSEHRSYKNAAGIDKQTINAILKLDTGALSGSQNSACAKGPLLLLINIAEQFNWRPYLSGYGDNNDSSKSGKRTTGYGVIAFYGGTSVENTSSDKTTVFREDQGQLLLKIARRTIAKRLGYKTDAVEIPDDPAFNSIRGTFVTLKKENQLRGCIGNLSADVTVVEGVARNAIHAAFNDTRFSPLTKAEVEAIEIEVSVLTEPVRLDYKDPSELIAKLRPGIDGVIIRKGDAGATFLPQVWEQLPTTVSFLEQLCLKAGLQRNEWQAGDLEVEIYQVQYFEE